MEKNAGSEEFFQEVARIGKGIHVSLAGAHRWHSSDICFAVEDVPRLDGMGPIGFGERTENEHVLRSSLVDHAALLALVIRRCRK
jgi:hypothetical protein